MTSQQRKIMLLPNFFVSMCQQERPSCTAWKYTASLVRQADRQAWQTGRHWLKWTDSVTDWVTIQPTDWLLSNWLTAISKFSNWHTHWLELVWYYWFAVICSLSVMTGWLQCDWTHLSAFVAALKVVGQTCSCAEWSAGECLVSTDTDWRLFCVSQCQLMSVPCLCQAYWLR